MRRLRAGVRAMAWAMAGIAVGLALACGGPVLVGMRSLTVLSGSMEPVLSTGDVVVEEVVRPQEVRVGDVITFTDPSDPNRRITHRVRSVRLDGSRARFTTKGDANDSVEKWETDTGGRLGRVVYRVPLVGFAFARLGDPRARLGLVVVPAALLALIELGRIWRPRRRDGEVRDVAA